jgi:hypothetical protein
MQRSRPDLPFVRFATLLLAAAGACGSPPPANSEVFPDAATRRSSSSPLREVARSALEAELTSITHVAVDSRGRAYVADFYRNGVTVLAADGRLLRTIGRRGSGPDEFRAIRSLQILPGDSLLVYDGTLARIGVAAQFQPVLADSMPARWPAVSAFLIDDRDRLWFGLAGPPEAPVEWVAFTPAGGYLGSFVAPAGTVVRAIRAAGTVYAERRDADGVPHLVVMEMARPLR